MKQSLFVYGTLEVSEVISSLIGREKLSSTAFALDHFRCLLKGQVYPGMVPYLGRVTSGRLYIDLTDSDFEILDHFEGSIYRREQINVYLLKGGISTASSYILKNKNSHLMSDESWNRQVFINQHLNDYLAKI
tara:strand:- start:974 stop:1372 length:399 start_codon:yes stop_codon:yes gene_type:complete